MGIINWILLILFWVLLIYNSNRQEFITPIIYLYLGIILFYLTPSAIYDALKYRDSDNPKWGGLLAFLGFTTLLIFGSIVILYDGHVANPVVVSGRWTFLYIAAVIIVCIYTSFKRD